MRKSQLYIILFAIVLAGCSTEKDRLVNRKYHEVTAHFNAYFNGEEAYEKAVLGFEQTEELDFEALLPLYYWPDEKQAPSLFNAMDRAIEKSAKVVKNHSMVFSGKQKNAYVFKAYLLIARSKFYKYELLPALEACTYIIDNFDGIEAAREEVFYARLLAAQIHDRMNNGYQSERQLDELYTKRLPKKELHEAEKAYAYHYVQLQQWNEAQQWVQMAAKSATDKEEEVRLTYINAQLLAKLGMGYESALAYQRVLELHPNNYDITFSAQIKRAENFDVFMEDIGVIEKELNKMLRDDKNVDYRDQIYYVWALKKLDLEHYPEAEELLGKSVATSVNNDRQKGKSYLKLADISFDFRAFVAAQGYYDSALAVLPAEYPGLDTLKERTEVLNELVGHLSTIALEDSLQSLYGMSEVVLKEKFEKYIEDMKARDAEAARQAEIAALNAAQNADLASSGPKANGTGGAWYFYNPQVRTSGKATFKKLWGDRRLEDHWRTAQKPADGLGDFVVDEGELEVQDSTGEQAMPSDKYTVEYYLSRLLKSDADLAKSRSREAQALAEVGFVYKDGLKDNVQAKSVWEEYMKGFVLEAPTPKVLYGQYLLYGELEEDALRAAAKDQLLADYEMSPYAQLLKGTLKGPEVPEAEQQAYDLAYADFERARWKSASKKLDQFDDQYPGSVLQPKTKLLRAYIAGGQGKEAEVESLLKAVVAEYKGTEEALRAAQILALLSDDSQSEEGGSDKQGSGDQAVAKIDFPDQPKAPHKFILAVPAENAQINDLRNAFADFNKEHFKFDNLKIQNIFYNQSTQLIIISGLHTKEKAQIYFQTFSSQGATVEQYYPKERSSAFYINNPNFGKVYRDKVLNEYIQYFNKL